VVDLCPEAWDKSRSNIVSDLTLGRGQTFPPRNCSKKATGQKLLLEQLFCSTYSGAVLDSVSILLPVHISRIRLEGGKLTVDRIRFIKKLLPQLQVFDLDYDCNFGFGPGYEKQDAYYAFEKIMSWLCSHQPRTKKLQELGLLVPPMYELANGDDDNDGQRNIRTCIENLILNKSKSLTAIRFSFREWDLYPQATLQTIADSFVGACSKEDWYLDRFSVDGW